MGWSQTPRRCWGPSPALWELLAPAGIAPGEGPQGTTVITPQTKPGPGERAQRVSRSLQPRYWRRSVMQIEFLRVEYDVVDEVLDEEDAAAIGAVELFGVQRGADGGGIETRP